MERWAPLALALALGCGDVGPSTLEDPAGSVAVVPRGELDGGSAPVDAEVADPAVSITDPMDGASFARSGIDMGDWVAFVDVSVSVQGVQTLEVQVDGDPRARVDVPAAIETVSLALRGNGTRTLTAVGLDASGLERARDQITVEVTPPDDGSCHAMLDALGLDWEPSGSQQGIGDPVYVQPYFGSVAFRYVSNDSPTRLLMDCELAPRLHHLAMVLEELGIDEAIHIGIYNYRCIGGGDPDSGTCTPSQHAYARAIDLWGFGLAGSDTEYVLERDWIITAGATCPGTATEEADRVLHEIGCRMYEEGIFETILTPNYNDAHRNHFHVDMTEGRMFIETGVAGVDPDVPGLGH
ncbi:MAG: extensin family protein [Deltaproteobacteria bacterium]|nr:extensin family protein [Deltaproteobacteria bacterium]